MLFNSPSCRDISEVMRRLQDYVLKENVFKWTEEDGRTVISDLQEALNVQDAASVMAALKITVELARKRAPPIERILPTLFDLQGDEDQKVQE